MITLGTYCTCQVTFIRYFLFPTLAFIPTLLAVLLNAFKSVICVLHNRRGWFSCSEPGGGRML